MVPANGPEGPAAAPPRATRGSRSQSIRPLLLGSAASMLALVVLGLLVAHGTLSGLDTYGIRHWMPDIPPDQTPSYRVLGPLLGYGERGFHLGPALRTLASPIPSTLLVALLAFALYRRGNGGRAAGVIVAFVVINVAEAVGKLAIAKPPLFGISDGELTPAGFVHSFPSGHTARAALLAVAAGYLAPKARPLLAVLFAGIVVATVLDGAHTVSDVIGGLLLAVAGIMLIPAVEILWRVRFAQVETRSSLPA